MPGKFLFLSLFICCAFLIGSTRASEMTELVNSALLKLENCKKNVDALIDELQLSPQQQDIIHEITATRLDYGSVLSERAHFEMEQISTASCFIASLLKVSQDVIKCMNDTTEEAQKENEKFVMDRFNKPLRDNEYNTANQELDTMFNWIYDNADRYNKFIKDYNEAVKAIKNAENEEEISATLKTIKQEGDSLANSAKQAIEKIKQFQKDHLVFADKSLNELRVFIRGTVDKITEALQDCLFVKSPNYNLKNIFFKLM